MSLRINRSWCVNKIHARLSTIFIWCLIQETEWYLAYYIGGSVYCYLFYITLSNYIIIWDFGRFRVYCTVRLLVPLLAIPRMSRPLHFTAERLLHNWILIWTEFCLELEFLRTIFLSGHIRMKISVYVICTKCILLFVSVCVWYRRILH